MILLLIFLCGEQEVRRESVFETAFQVSLFPPCPLHHLLLFINDYKRQETSIPSAGYCWVCLSSLIYYRYESYCHLRLTLRLIYLLTFLNKHTALHLHRFHPMDVYLHHIVRSSYIFVPRIGQFDIQGEQTSAKPMGNPKLTFLSSSHLSHVCFTDLVCSFWIKRGCGWFI